VYTRVTPKDYPRPPGRLTNDDLAMFVPPDANEQPSTAYVCGSSGFADAASHAVVDLGFPAERVRVERFGPTA